ncbi:hypothetical protein JB92DRAFT_3132745 [Gautieria morchelliformis]|nr:hypothetical protein JB92DRAFT_3132745 [Gautieria morchelliformis]
MAKTVFLTGATGYIGGAALAHLLSSPSTKSYAYSALVRNKDKAALLESLGVRPVLGTLDNNAVLSAEAEKADVVIHTANSADHMASCKAILEGMKKRSDNPILIHISGTGVLCDDARGEYATDNIYSDLDPAHINAVPDTALHRDVELLVLSASPKIRTHIISPPTIYGIADHALVRWGISNNSSQQLPGLIRVSIARGQAGFIGKGLNVWGNVHISEIAAAIATVFEAAIEGKTATGREGYYFAESGEYTAYEVSKEVARDLHARGIGKPEPTPFTDEDFKNYSEWLYYLGSNSRCRADRTRRLGWTTTHTNEDFLRSIGPEVDYLLKAAQNNESYWVDPLRLQSILNHSS